MTNSNGHMWGVFPTQSPNQALKKTQLLAVEIGRRSTDQYVSRNIYIKGLQDLAVVSDPYISPAHWLD